MMDAMSEDDLRSVSLTRLETGVYEARNARGGTLRFGSSAGEDFTPVELLLAAVAGCSAVDIDVVTARRTEPERFEATSTAKVVHGADGNLLREVTVTFLLRFPAGEAGDKARMVVPAAARASHDRTCTVSRTIEAAVPVRLVVDEQVLAENA